MTARVSDPDAPIESERDLLARLGLGAGASNDDVESAHDEILEFLDRAPAPLRRWARSQASAVDEAYAALNVASPPPARAKAAPPMVAIAGVPRSARAAAPQQSADPDDDFSDYGDELHEPVIRSRRQQRLAARPAGPAAGLAGSGFSLRRIATIAGIAGVVVAAVAIYQLGAPVVPGFTGTPGPASSQSAIDPAQVAALMQKLQANPKDLATLRDLGNLYYGGGDFATAASWMEKILAISPNDEEALLAYGATKFNLGDVATAETSWLKVIALNPKNAEAHFDLGFVYLSKDPPDTTKARTEWQAAVAIDPTSDVGKNAANHLNSLAALSSGNPSAAPGASPGSSVAPGASPTPSGGAAASPAPSPAAS